MGATSKFRSVTPRIPWVFTPFQGLPDYALLPDSFPALRLATGDSFEAPARHPYRSAFALSRLIVFPHVRADWASSARSDLDKASRFSLIQSNYLMRLYALSFCLPLPTP